MHFSKKPLPAPTSCQHSSALSNSQLPQVCSYTGLTVAPGHPGQLPRTPLTQEPSVPMGQQFCSALSPHSSVPVPWLSPATSQAEPCCLQTQLPNSQFPRFIQKVPLVRSPQSPEQERQRCESQTQAFPTPSTMFICLSSSREGIKSPSLPHLLPQAAGKALLLRASFQACLVSMAN